MALSTLDAAQLRAMGIGNRSGSSDEDLVATVEFLLELGLELDQMVGEDLTYLAGPRIIRPDAVIGLDEAFDAGHDAAFRQRTALALGFNVVNTGGRLTPAEVDAINFFQSLRPLLGDEDLLALLRVMGNSLARIARSVLSALRVHLEAPVHEATGSIVEVARAYKALTEDMLPPMLDATTTVLRRHLSIGAGRPTIWTVDENRVATTELVTVGFVDLVGFTAFTEQADLKGFVEALSAFESRTQSVIVANGGTLVKLIGDEVMFVAPTPASGIEIARRLAALSMTDSGPASVRIALATGEVVAIGGDYYGTVVNIASRSVAEADPDTIVVTAEVANGAHASARFDSIGARTLRGISEPVELYRLL